MPGRTLEVKMAKPTEEDFSRVREFLDMIEEVMEYGTYTPPNDDGEEISEIIGSERLLELIEAAWGGPGQIGVGVSWRRVVWGGKVAIDNCCDPDADVLEWLPAVIEWEAAVAKMSHRKCRDCGHVAYYLSDTLPQCACEKCGSADTRPIRRTTQE